jgi:hypothetical protein
MRVNPAAKALVLFVLVALTLSFWFAPELKPVDIKQPSFTYTSSSQLYFKNIRSFYYNIYPDQKSKFTIYKIKRRERDSSKVWLQFNIIQNQLMDEAYIYADLNSLNEQWVDPQVILSNRERDKRISLLNLNNERHYQLAAAVFNQLLSNDPIFLMNGNDTIQELYATKSTNFSASIALEDYFKLINKL